CRPGGLHPGGLSSNGWRLRETSTMRGTHAHEKVTQGPRAVPGCETRVGGLSVQFEFHGDRAWIESSNLWRKNGDTHTRSAALLLTVYQGTRSVRQRRRLPCLCYRATPCAVRGRGSQRHRWEYKTG